jgi:hypothetical protein
MLVRRSVDVEAPFVVPREVLRSARERKRAQSDSM